MFRHKKNEAVRAAIQKDDITKGIKTDLSDLPTPVPTSEWIRNHITTQYIQTGNRMTLHPPSGSDHPRVEGWLKPWALEYYIPVFDLHSLEVAVKKTREKRHTS